MTAASACVFKQPPWAASSKVAQTAKKKQKNPKSSCSHQLSFLRKVSVHAGRGKKGRARSSSAPLDFPSASTSGTILCFAFSFEKSMGQSSSAGPSRRTDSRLQEGESRKAQEFSEAALCNAPTSALHVRPARKKRRHEGHFKT